MLLSRQIFVLLALLEGVSVQSKRRTITKAVQRRRMLDAADHEAYQQHLNGHVAIDPADIVECDITGFYETISSPMNEPSVVGGFSSGVAKFAIQCFPNYQSLCQADPRACSIFNRRLDEARDLRAQTRHQDNHHHNNEKKNRLLHHVDRMLTDGGGDHDDAIPDEVDICYIEKIGFPFAMNETGVYPYTPREGQASVEFAFLFIAKKEHFLAYEFQDFYTVNPNYMYEFPFDLDSFGEDSCGFVPFVGLQFETQLFGVAERDGILYAKFPMFETLGLNYFTVTSYRTSTF